MEAINKNTHDLTACANSAWKILKLATPLILTELSTSLMFVLDRLILSNYSYHSMNAAVSASASIGVCQYGVMALTTIATVFAGKHNGAKNYYRVPEPIWQMIWFSIGSSIFFILFGIYGGETLVNPNFHDEGLPYYRILMSFGFLISLIGAVSSFFVSTGRTKVIIYSVISANLINLILDIILVFGIPSIISPMGTKGAAIATVIGQSLQAIFLLTIFLNRHNRKIYKTDNYKIKMSTLKECLIVGVPSAMSDLIEFIAWAFIVYMIGNMGDEYMLVFSIGNTLFYLYMFTLDGLYQITSSIASNIIGANKFFLIKRLMLSSIRIHLIFAVVLMLPAIIFPETFIKAFSFIKQEKISLSILQTIHISLIAVWIYFIIDGVTWIISSILTAFKDTLTPMLLNAIALLLLTIVPIWIFVVKNHGEPSLIQIIPCFYTFALAIAYGLRLKTRLSK